MLLPSHSLDPQSHLPPQAGAPHAPGRWLLPGCSPTRGAAPSPPAPASSAWWRPSTARWHSGPPARTPARGAKGDSAAQGEPQDGGDPPAPTPSPLTLTSLDTGLAADVLSCRTCGTGQHSGGFTAPHRLPPSLPARPPRAITFSASPAAAILFLSAGGHGAARPRAGMAAAPPLSAARLAGGCRLLAAPSPNQLHMQGGPGALGVAVATSWRISARSKAEN